MEFCSEGCENIIFPMKVLCKKFFDIDGDLVFCDNVDMLMTDVSIEHKQKIGGCSEHHDQSSALQVGRMGRVPTYGGNGDSRNVSCSKPSLHCRKRPREGALYKWLTKSAYGAI